MAGNTLKVLMAQANAVVDAISVREAIGLVDDETVVLVDIRETAERERERVIPGAIHASRSFLEFIADAEGPMHNPAFSSGKRLVLFCASGGRSTLAVKTLMDMGFSDVVHITGGFAAWREAGGPIEPVSTTES